MRRLGTILAIGLAFSASPQDSQFMSHETYIKQVMQHHPMVYRADIVQQQGEANLKAARGNFDPKLFGDIGQKYFKDQQYYSEMKGGIKIPTWFGISIEAGYEQNQGIYLNPQRNVPDAGLWYAGLRLDLGNGLIMNQRRAQFEKAKIYQNQSEIEKIILKNQLLYDASNAYWKWYFSYEKMKVYENALSNAEIRFSSIKDAAKFGDKPFIDTVEAFILVQNRELSLIEAQTSLNNAELKMELFLWSEGLVPLEIENIQPERTDASEIERLLIKNIDLSDHPYMSMNRFKIESKEVDLKLKREQFKPDLTLKYNALSEPVNNSPIANYSTANYNWGASLSYPILSRKAIGSTRLAKLKLEDQKIATTFLEAEIETKVRTAKNNLVLAKQQFNINTALVSNNERLYSAEEELFALGESSVFLINSRENKLLKTRIDLLNAHLEVLSAYNGIQLNQLTFRVE